MYLPRSLPLCNPSVAVWAGESGKRYDFAITRTGSMCIDEPAVYVFVKREGEVWIPLYVGQTSNLQRRFGVGADRCPDEWRRAMAAGMTHVHVRFDPCSARARQLEARDLVAALRPAFNDAAAHEPEETPDPHMPLRKGAGLFSLHANVPQRMSLAPAAAAAKPLGAPTAHAFHPGLSFSRLDPAREEFN